MSRGNVEIVREIYRAWERGDFTSNEWADPEIEFHIRAGPDEAVHHGVDAMGYAWREWLGAWDEFKTEAREFIDLGDDVLVLAEFRGRGKASGMPIEAMAGAGLFSLRDGKVVRLGTYTDPAEALEAAGLSE
jgi:ketosteroid isomerase-like protein